MTRHYTESFAERWCHTHKGFAPAKDFRFLPGAKRREVCANCYERIRAGVAAAVPASEARSDGE